MNCIILKKIADLQPSQFYMSEKKLSKVKDWFNPNNLSNFDPIPIKVLGGEMVILDGHTRCVCAVMCGLDTIPVEYDDEILDWDMYAECVKERKIQIIISPFDLVDRIISQQDYVIKWDGWCDIMQANVIECRNADSSNNG